MFFYLLLKSGIRVDYMLKCSSYLTSATALRRPVLLQLATVSTLFGSLSRLELALVGSSSRLELAWLGNSSRLELVATRRTFANSLKDRAMLLTSLSPCLLPTTMDQSITVQRGSP